MSRRIFINGMGRIGRLFFRKAFDAEGTEIVGVNDIYMKAENLAYLLKHDTVYGNWIHGDTTLWSSIDGNEYIDVFGKSISFYHERSVANLPLNELDVDMIIDCSGAYSINPIRFAADAKAAGARAAAISYLGDNSVPVFVYGVNAFSGEKINTDSSLISFGSCSLNAAAWLLKAINNGPGVESAFIEVVRSYTGDQNLCDNIAGNAAFERGRAAAQNIVPTSTGAGKNIGLIVPELFGKTLGTALRTPTIVGGAINASIVMPKSFTTNEINAMMKAAASDAFTYSEERLVSSDVVSNDSIPTFLAQQTMVNGNVCNVTLLYDNEMGFVNQMINLMLKCNLFVNGSQIW